MNPITMATSADVGARAAEIAVLPVGSFEQHGAHLPLATDTVIASLIATEIADAHRLFLLPPVTISCSHEHAGFPGTLSISAPTLHRIVTDIADDLARSGIRRLVLVNGHGGNYVLSNLVQEWNARPEVPARRMLLFPGRDDWAAASASAGLTTDSSADMHAGERETSLLLHAAPDLVGDGWISADQLVDERSDLLVRGVRGYSDSGVIGMPSAASAEKGEALLTALSERFEMHLPVVRED